MGRSHLVFVYGTLKQGEPNYCWMTKEGAGSFKFLGEARTKEKYPLIISTKYNIPFLLYSPGDGCNVKGELYEVDEKMLKHLDVLEDHPNFYEREEKEIELLSEAENVVVKPWIYFIRKFKPELLKETMYECYSNNGSHGLRYVERYLRAESVDYRKEILSDVTSKS